jgi:hypothetical protein
MPPKVSSIEKKGSIIKKDFHLFGIEVMARSPPMKKKIKDMDRIWV